MNSLFNCSGAYQVSARRVLVLTFISSFFLFVIACFSSCGPSHEETGFREKTKSAASEALPYRDEIATDTISGTTRNFIRQASIHFKVKNVLESTTKIEELVSKAGGFVTNSDLNSNKDYTNRVQVKKDSLLETTYYTLTSNITLRVPNKKLDSVLNQVTAMAEFVDSRNIKADDVKLKLLANGIREKRNRASAGNISEKIKEKNHKLASATEAEETRLQKETRADDLAIESLELADQVNYSTVTLSLYQAQTMMSILTPTPVHVEPYAPSFGERLGTSLLNGFEVIKGFIILLANCWGILLILFGLFLLTRSIILYYTKKPSEQAKVSVK